MSEKVTVTVTEGKVRGVRKRSKFSGTEFYSFYGVPYGQPTGGASRFKDPVKVKPWGNILDATAETKKGCLQISVQFGGVLFGSEDCLYNNIHTPKIPSKGDPPKAVIVNIHPGGYFHGSPETWYYGSPNYVMHNDIVYVCIAHRLQILGYLNLGLEQCSGNQALKDIILGLEWIKDNISAFGGDPNNITLIGSSSSALIIHYLMLSPKAKGLFHKAVMMGGYIFVPTIITFEENESLAVGMAKQRGYKHDVNDKEKLLSFLKKIRPEDLVKMRYDQTVNHALGTPFPSSAFKPTVDQGENAVLPKPCRKLIDSMTRVPLMYGICEREGVMGFCKGLRKATTENFITGLRSSCDSWARDTTDDELQFIRNKIEEFYSHGKQIETAPLSVQIDVQTDAGQSDVYPTLLDVISRDLPSSVYVYKFTFEGNATTTKAWLSRTLDKPIEGSFHSDDYCYFTQVVEKLDAIDRQLTPQTIEMIYKFTNIISTFAKTGNPNHKDLNVSWNPSTIEKPCYMKIDTKMELIGGKLNGKRMQFWENLKKELNRE